MHPARPRHQAITNQRGAALIVMLVIMVMGIAAALVNSLSITALKTAHQEKTAAALAEAKEALISYALSSENAGGATARPGNFPCPDTDVPSPTNPNYGIGESSCAAGAIGRLPWKTLGLPELLDEEGEPLWYALSGNFLVLDRRKGHLIVGFDFGNILKSSHKSFLSGKLRLQENLQHFLGLFTDC